jgi:coenzyme F420-reducing hydrogenase gamma subunit
MIGNPMQATCGAHCRTTGEPCKNYKMENGRCRMHGGKSTGRPKTHGNFSKEALEERARVVELNRAVRSLLREI